MLLNRLDTSVLLIDVQEKLTSHIHEKERLIKNCAWVLSLANDLEIPVLASEQYPQGLGTTVADLTSHLRSSALAKINFSFAADSNCLQQVLHVNRKQLVLIGIETHVCVLQSALQLKQNGFDIFVVTDAVSARSEHDHEIALRRLLHHGIELVTKEMLFFEWLRAAGTPQFKTLSQKYLRG